jgi:predicted DNA-binding WGR domain protein
MRRFELVEGTAAKFWEIEHSGSDYTVRYGRIGANGQSLSKSAESDAKAEVEVAKLIREKTGKGYTEVSVDASAAALQAAPASAVVSTKKSAAKPVKASPDEPSSAEANGAPQTPSASPRSVKASAPTGFVMTPAWKRIFFAQRGLAWKSPAGKSVDELLAVQFSNHNHSIHWMQRNDPRGTAFLAQFPKREQAVSKSNLLSTDTAAWQAIFAYAGVNYMQAGECTLTKFAIAKHGLRFALAQFIHYLHASYSELGENTYFQHFSRLEIFADALAKCSDTDYQDLLAESATWPDIKPIQYVIGAIFNTEPALLESAIAVLDDLPTQQVHGFELIHAKLSFEQAQRVFERQVEYSYYYEPLRVVAVNLAYHFGERALPMLLRLLEKQSTSEVKRKFGEVIAALNTQAAYQEILKRIDDKVHQGLADDFFSEHPMLATKAALELCAAGKNKTLESVCKRWLASGLDIDALNAQLSEAAQKILERLRGDDLSAQEAALDSLPVVLRDAPWLKPQPKIVRPELKNWTLPAAKITWATNEQAAWLSKMPKANMARLEGVKAHKEAALIFQHMNSINQAMRNVLITSGHDDYAQCLAAFTAATPAKIDWETYTHISGLAVLSPTARLLMWNHFLFTGAGWQNDGAPRGIIALHGLDALPGLQNLIRVHVPSGLNAAGPVFAPELVTQIAALLHTNKKHRALAGAWLKLHVEDSVAVLLVETQTISIKAKAAAEFALRWLRNNADIARIETGAAQQGAPGKALLDAIFAQDPLATLPQKPRELASFYVPGGFARPRLLNGDLLPLSAMKALGTMLQVSALDDPYAGLHLVKAACTPESLDAFAWDLFCAWNSSGAPSKENWAFLSCGLLGGDLCARNLTPLIRAWPGESQHARAVIGLDVLTAIGSDYALMQLHGISQKAKFKGLQENAVKKIQAIADARGLSSDELADRLVPDLDLDDNGTCTLDFGPRQFTVGFDEALRPFALDASGARLKDLPKPNKTDDADKANPASERWKGLKKDVKAIAQNQMQRLEFAMCQSRRWSLEVFEQFFVRHPLLRHLVRRLCWASIDANGQQQLFRVAEDLSYADFEDREIKLPAGTEIALPHVLDISDVQAAAFGQVFTDYEIIQPFPQLGREVYRLSDEERQSKVLLRFKGKRVASGSVYGLAHKGWRSGGAQDGGWIGWFDKALPDNLEAQIALEPGLSAGDPSYEPKQTLGELTLMAANSWNDAGKRSFNLLSDVTVSELLRDLDRMAVLLD